ncbi:hypothetical protein MBM_09867 [Drepanopeziza brunnea f. sp. 'multigermtubi' MB_m1]|uniref:MFS maltose permease n=1 Tax=Marssonina brunnea f. sp. multigermtubi (strain MB_m1) TaxID=1072389 RepID=K1XHS0_MARBU|nr:uncharacterized protein MBM_09867 [Drepanopeziza brunnea f. sp. 'multigermtubi' MB_m1]EKD12004.1 hypothetical protein MBM_09867 [Drepanopeziza brunnea f. sp. 'multigermtubi' MB_m1]
MRLRLPIRRIISLRPLRPPNAPRPFTQNTLPPRSARPQLPFLSSPTRRPPARFLTTERKAWLKDEFYKAGKYTIVIQTGLFLFSVIVFGLQQEYLNHRFPSPEEWSWLTRFGWRNARSGEDDDRGVGIVDWALTGRTYRWILQRLEDPDIDGAGLRTTDEGGILVAGIGKMGYDVTGKSEPWRRGYYECLMGAARAAEYLDGHVRDKTRGIAFPANVVIGPSNPNPRPVSPFSHSAPKEEDCEEAFEKPEVYYMRILTTQGFTDRQRIDAALAYAVWLDYKNTPQAAWEMHKWAVDIANASAQTPKPIIDPETGVIRTDAGAPSANILSVATALGIHHAVNSNLTLALPIFVSVLRARRSLPEVRGTTRVAPAPDTAEEETLYQKIAATARSILIPPKFPPPPDDGTAPPFRTPKERCEEAGVMTYIGEILYASKASKTSREDGLAWTREAVDLAEEELREKSVDGDARRICKECLETGLGNWMAMVSKLAREEEEGKKTEKRKKSASGWLGLGGGEGKDTAGRWESEEKVVVERLRRAKDILDAETVGR